MKTVLLAWLGAATLSVTPPELGSDVSWGNFLTAYPEVRTEISRHEKWIRSLPPEKAAWVEQLDQQFDADPVWAKEMLGFIDAQTEKPESMSAIRSLDQFLGDNKLYEAAELLVGDLLLNENFARTYRNLVVSMATADGFVHHGQCFNYFLSHQDEANVVYNTDGRGGIEAYRRQYPASAPLWQPCLDFLDRNPHHYGAVQQFYIMLRNEPDAAAQLNRIVRKLREETNEAMMMELWQLRARIARDADFWVRFLNHERARASRGDSAATLLRLRRELSKDADTGARVLQYRRWVLSHPNLSRRMHERRMSLKSRRKPVVLGQTPEPQTDSY